MDIASWLHLFSIPQPDIDEDLDSDLLLTNADEDDYPLWCCLVGLHSPHPPVLVRRVKGDSSSAAVDLDLQDMCKRAVAKLNIKWPEVQAQVVRSFYDGNKLPKVKRLGKQVMAFFPELLDELGWRRG